MFHIQRTRTSYAFFLHQCLQSGKIDLTPFLRERVTITVIRHNIASRLILTGGTGGAKGSVHRCSFQSFDTVFLNGRRNSFSQSDLSPPVLPFKIGHAATRGKSFLTTVEPLLNDPPNLHELVTPMHRDTRYMRRGVCFMLCVCIVFCVCNSMCYILLYSALSSNFVLGGDLHFRKATYLLICLYQ